MSKFVVVLEGCDKTGKTSLARELSAILGWPIVKHSQPKTQEPIEEYWQTLLDHPEAFIADRYHMGESVYGPIYRKTNPIDLDEIHRLERAVTMRGALLILMTDKPEGIVERFKREREDFAREDDVKRIVQAFDREFYLSRLPKIRLSYDEVIGLSVANLIRSMERVEPIL